MFNERFAPEVKKEKAGG